MRACLNQSISQLINKIKKAYKAGEMTQQLENVCALTTVCSSSSGESESSSDLWAPK